MVLSILDPSGAGTSPSPFFCLARVKLLAIAQSGLVVALTTIYWPALSRLEGHFTFLTTLSAYSRVHLAHRPVSIVATEAIALGSSCFTTGGTALGLIGIPFGSIKLLLLSSEAE